MPRVALISDTSPVPSAVEQVACSVYPGLYAPATRASSPTFTTSVQGALDVHYPCRMGTPDHLAEVRVLCVTLEEACRRASEAIDHDQPEIAFAAANELTELIARAHRATAGIAAGLRSRSAGRIWEAEKLSLAALADRIGVSKARADQLIRSIKKPQGEGGSGD